MLRSGKRSSCLLAQVFATFTPSLCPDFCKNKFGAPTCPTHCIWSSGAWPKAKISYSGKQTLYPHSWGWCISPNLPYFTFWTGNIQWRWRQPSSVSGTAMTKWPSSMVLATHAAPRGPNASKGITEANCLVAQEIMGDMWKGWQGGYFFV